MIQRCTNPNCSVWKYYGAKGIKVCERWRYDFITFLEDVGYKPDPKLSLDRYPDCNGDYEPRNVRWATRKEQAANTNRVKLARIKEKERQEKITLKLQLREETRLALQRRKAEYKELNQEERNKYNLSRRRCNYCKNRGHKLADCVVYREKLAKRLRLQLEQENKVLQSV